MKVISSIKENPTMSLMHASSTSISCFSRLCNLHPWYRTLLNISPSQEDRPVTNDHECTGSLVHLQYIFFLFNKVPIYCWEGRDSIEWELCSTLLYMTSRGHRSGIQTSGPWISSPLHYIHSAMLKYSMHEGNRCNKIYICKMFKILSDIKNVEFDTRWHSPRGPF